MRTTSAWRDALAVPETNARARLGALVLAVALVAGADDVTWAATTARCGMVVSERVVLDRDLRCNGPGLIVRNPRTVVQLNGHTLESSRPCGEEPGAAAIAVQPTADRAQILGPGLIRGFETGVTIDWAPQAQVRDVRISGSCAEGLVVRSAGNARGRDLILNRNGAGPLAIGAVRAEKARRFMLLDSEVFLNDGGAGSAAVELQSCEGCRVAGNRIVANQGAGLHLDVESSGNEIERNVILAHRPDDIFDEGSDNVFALNVFERGDGVSPPSLWPLLGAPPPTSPGVAGCGTMHAFVGPRQTVTVACPQDPGPRALRNSVVAYRLLNPFNTAQLFGATCNPAELRPASSTGGGAVTCTNPESVWAAVLEVTCCLN
jgi:hypothetical protein